MTRLVSLWEETTKSLLSLFLYHSRTWWEGTSTSQEESPHQKSILWYLNLGLLASKMAKKINFCCWSNPAFGIRVCQPKQTHTVTISLFSYLGSAGHLDGDDILGCSSKKEQMCKWKVSFILFEKYELVHF